MEPIRVLELRSVKGTGGGPEKTILLGAERCDRSRVAVTVCYLRNAVDEQFRIGERARGRGIDYIEILERHSFDPVIFFELRKLARQRNIALVHSHDYKTDFLALALRASDGIVPLATAHGWISNTRRERFYAHWDRRLLARFPLVLAVSGAIRAAVIQAGAKPSAVRQLRNGIDPHAFTRDEQVRRNIRRELQLGATEFVIGAAGRLEPEKRFDLLIEAAARVRAARPVVVAIAGEGSQRDDLQARAAARGVRLLLLGYRSDVREVQHAFDVYAQSSDTEGIPNAVLEAMALQVPVVATNVGGTAELIDDDRHGLLVPRGDAAQLAGAIQRTLDDTAAAARRVDAARKRVEDELSFDARTRTLDDIYVELAAATPGRRR